VTGKARSPVTRGGGPLHYATSAPHRMEGEHTLPSCVAPDVGSDETLHPHLEDVEVSSRLQQQRHKRSRCVLGRAE
jgi:hypothetical protein